MRSERPAAIVTDALWRKSVSAIRALGAAGYRVFALGDSVLTTGFYSRYTERRFRGPTASEDPAGFGETLQRAVAAAGNDPVAILPMEDASCEWLIQHGDELPAHAHWLLPDADAFAIARDKGRTADLAARCGVSYPHSFVPDSAEALGELVAAHDVERFIVKPRTGTGSGGILYGRRIMETALEQHWDQYGPLLLQERIPATGTALGVSLLYDRNSVCRAAFAHRRLRQYPVSGGPSTQRISIPLDEIYDMSAALMASLAWRGVAMVEWKVDPETGKPLLLEINPRFWGSLALAVRSGVDFPTLYADAALGRKMPAAPPNYAVGHMCRWLVPGDILRFLSEPREQRESLRCFLRDILAGSEEFDRSDVRGSVACVLCPAMLVANPKYWRYLRRDSTVGKKT